VSYQAQGLARALNAIADNVQFSYVKARGAARQDPQVDWQATKALNAEFNPDVDGCESFVMRDGSICEWTAGRRKFVAKPSSGS